MYQFTHPLPNIYCIIFKKSYIGQILMKDGYIIDIILYDCSYDEFMDKFLFEVGVDEIYAYTEKRFQEFYEILGFKLVDCSEHKHKMVFNM